MGILSALFGSSDTSNKIVDSVVSAGDAMFYTDEEKAQASERGFELWLEYQRATQPQNVSRRALAVIVASVWALFIIACGVGIVGGFDYADRLSDFTGDKINSVFMLVMTFYFVKRFLPSKQK